MRLNLSGAHLGQARMQQVPEENPEKTGRPKCDFVKPGRPLIMVAFRNKVLIGPPDDSTFPFGSEISIIMGTL